MGSVLTPTPSKSGSDLTPIRSHIVPSTLGVIALLFSKRDIHGYTTFLQIHYEICWSILI